MTKKEITLTMNELLASYEQNKALIDSLEAQQKVIEQLLFEISSAKSALKEIRKGSRGQKILVPLGSGVYAYAKLEETNAVKMEIASHIFRRMPIETSLEKLEERESMLRRTAREISERKKKALETLARIEKLIVEAQRKAREMKNLGVA